MPKWLKPTLFIVSLGPFYPFVYLHLMYYFGAPNTFLGPDPVKTTLWNMGIWSLRFLIITLAITPLRKFTGWAWLMPLRRMFGLYAFAYAAAHFYIFFYFDQQLSLSSLWHEIYRHPYITAGMGSLLVMLPLAITSTDKMIKRLGGKRWRNLHKLVYAAGIFAVLHFYWMKMSKHLTTEPLVYAAILAVLLGYRVADHYGRAPRLPRKKRA